MERSAYSTQYIYYTHIIYVVKSCAGKN
jgi:hypothetical protein